MGSVSNVFLSENIEYKELLISRFKINVLNNRNGSSIISIIMVLKQLKMEQLDPKCIKCVGERNYIKYGKTKNGKQRYKCKSCGRSFVEDYTYKAYKPQTDIWITALVKENTMDKHLSILLAECSDVITGI